MKKSISVLAFSLLAFASPHALAGSGHVAKVVDVQVDSVDNGLKQIKIKNSVLNPEEIKFLDLTRSFLSAQFGPEASQFPVMVDLIRQRSFYWNPSTQQMIEIPFGEL
jgi:hypothetical protein